MYTNLKWLVFFCISLWQVNCGPNVVYKTTNVVCITSSQLFVNFSCHVKAVSWEKAVMQMDVDLPVPLLNVTANLQVFKKDYSNRYQPFLVDATVNLCDIMAKRSFSTYGIIFVKILKRFTNFNQSCPVQDHIFARNLYIDENLIPDLPLGFYQIIIVVTENYKRKPSKSAAVIKFYFQTMARRNMNQQKQSA